MKTFTTTRNNITIPDKRLPWWRVDPHWCRDHKTTREAHLSMFVDTVAEHVDAVATATGQPVSSVVDRVCRDLAEEEGVLYSASRWRFPPSVRIAICNWYAGIETASNRVRVLRKPEPQPKESP
jgi:hypothetical protein